MSRRTVTGALVATLALVLTAPASAAPLDRDAVLSPVAISVLNPPDPVLAADNRRHLAYELRLANLSGFDVTIDSVQPRARGKPLGAPLDGARLAAALRLDSQEDGTTLGPGEGATIFMDVTFARRAQAPRKVIHGFQLSPEDPSGVFPAQLGFPGGRTKVHRSKAVKLAPPLRGPRWLDTSGCCERTPHREAILAIDGTLHVPERFAIDFSQLDAQNRQYTGPVNELSSFAYMRAPVHAVAGGKVVRTQDGLPNQVPGDLPAGVTVQTAGGNFVVVDIGRGRFAFYAHLDPGSLRVEKGDRVRRGEVVGLLGNSGNTDAPHLHFHVMDSPSPLESNGLPFTFNSFRGQGVVTDRAPLFEGDPAAIDAAAFAGRHRRQLPMDDQLLEFP
jgi:hypothetical protein